MKIKIFVILITGMFLWSCSKESSADTQDGSDVQTGDSAAIDDMPIADVPIVNDGVIDATADAMNDTGNQNIGLLEACIAYYTYLYTQATICASLIVSTTHSSTTLVFYQGPESTWHLIDTFCKATVDMLNISIAAGRFSVDDTALSACVASLRALPSCGKMLSSETLFCSQAMKGTVKENGDCYDTVECEKGLYCHRGVTKTCPGKCAPYAKENDACGDRPCDPDLGLECNFDDQCVVGKAKGYPCGFTDVCADDSICIENRCRVLVPMGAGNTCGLLSEDTAAACPEGQYCVYDTAVPIGHCKHLLTENSDCTYYYACAYDLDCQNGQCLPRKKADEVCEYATDTCVFGYKCIDGVCFEESSLTAGSDCVSNQQCASGLCNDKKCADPKDIGLSALCTMR